MSSFSVLSVMFQVILGLILFAASQVAAQSFYIQNVQTGTYLFVDIAGNFPSFTSAPNYAWTIEAVQNQTNAYTIRHDTIYVRGISSSGFRVAKGDNDGSNAWWNIQQNGNYSRLINVWVNSNYNYYDYIYYYNNNNVFFHYNRNADSGNAANWLFVSTAQPSPILVDTTDTSVYGTVRNWLLSSGTSFTQSFVASKSGLPRLLGVHMGNNQNAFSVSLSFSINNTQVFSNTFSGLVQSGDWKVLFNLNVSVPISIGDTVSFTLSNPSTGVGFGALTQNFAGFTQGTLSRYGACNSAFYLLS